MSSPFGDSPLLPASPLGPPRPTPQFTLPGHWFGMAEPGNIDLANRPVVRNPDGSVSTVKSISFGIGPYEVLMPQVVGGKVVSPFQALQHYITSGQHLGKFTSPEAANAYAVALHREQARTYLPKGSR